MRFEEALKCMREGKKVKLRPDEPSEAMDFEHSDFYGECEVVGNINENPDLMENKDE